MLGSRMKLRPLICVKKSNHKILYKSDRFGVCIQTQGDMLCDCANKSVLIKIWIASYNSLHIVLYQKKKKLIVLVSQFLVKLTISLSLVLTNQICRRFYLELNKLCVL